MTVSLTLRATKGSPLTHAEVDANWVALRDGIAPIPVADGDGGVLSADASGTTYTNEGATAVAVFTLPTAAAGLTYTFIVQDADGIRVTPASGDSIRIESSTVAAAGYFSATAIGSTVTLQAVNASEWIATSVIGTWTSVAGSASITLSRYTVADDAPIGSLVAAINLSSGTVGTPVYTVTDESDQFETDGSDLVIKAPLDFTVDTIHNVGISTSGVTPPPPFALFTIYVVDHATATTDGGDVEDFFVDGSVNEDIWPELGLDPRNNMLDSFVQTVRSVALRDVQTTGTIGAASTSLTVASATGFIIGDTIIIATGGEAGLGERGTGGVGGTWPALSYANEAAMLADTGQTAEALAWLEDTGDVWTWNQFGALTWVIMSPARYYHQKVNPQALVTTITNIAGNVLTLADPSVAASTGANVYLDNKPIIDAAQALGGTRVILDMPAGTFALSDRLTFFSNRPGWTIRGAGMDNTTLLVPDGVWSSSAQAVVHVYQSPDFTVRDFHLHHNFRLQGFGLSNGFSYSTSGFPQGIIFGLSYDGLALNIKGTDISQCVIGGESGEFVWAYGCKSVHTDPLSHYVQWDFLYANNHGGGFVDCEVDSEWYVAGFSTFVGFGTIFLRPVSRNGVMEWNSSGGCKIIDAAITMEEHKRYSDTSFSVNTPIININANTGVGDQLELGGLVENAIMVMEGYATVASNDTLMAIVVNAENPDITITGGSYTAPDWLEPTVMVGPVGINSTGENTNVTGFTCLGATRGDYANIIVQNGTVTDCTADSIINPP